MANTAKTRQSILEGTGINYNDLFDLQDELDTNGGTYVAKTGVAHQDGSWNSHGSDSNVYGNYNADTLGSILGQGDAIGAYKNRKKEQQSAMNQGVGRSQSILGGTVV